MHSHTVHLQLGALLDLAHHVWLQVVDLLMREIARSDGYAKEIEKALEVNCH